MSLKCGSSHINNATLSIISDDNTTTAPNSFICTFDFQQQQDSSTNTGGENIHLNHNVNILRHCLSEVKSYNERSTQTAIRSSRFTIFLITFGFQLPLLATFSFGNDMFLDGTLPSLTLFCGFCVMNMTQLLFIILKKPVTPSEIIVYSVLLAAALAIISYTYYQQLLVGIDNFKNFILNIVALSVSGTNVVYDMFRERKKMSS